MLQEVNHGDFNIPVLGAAPVRGNNNLNGRIPLDYSKAMARDVMTN